MKAVSATSRGGITIGSIVKVDDNSGAKLLKVIAKQNYKPTKRRLPYIRVGDVFFASVIKGKKDLRKKVVRAVLVRQRKPYRRRNGIWVSFEDNAAVLITEKNEPQGSEIKGVVAKEVAERFPKVATIARNVV